MRWWRSISAWLPWSSRQHNEDDLEREIRTHLDLEAEEQRESGLPPDEARHAARRAFGNVTLVKEDVRQISAKTSLEQVGQDMRYAARQFRKNPGFAMVAVLTMGLGIGANTAVFSVIHALLLREPPYADPSRLTSLWQSLPKAGEIRLGTSPAEYLDYRDRNRSFASIAGYYRTAFDLTDGHEPDRITAACVTASLFPTLGIAPLLGQTFTATEEQPGAAKVALLSNAYWRQRYGGDPHVVGAALKLNEQLYTVVGVMPPGFEFPSTSASVEDPPVLWVPLVYTPKQIADRAASFDTNVVARLKPGVSLEQAREDVARVAAEFEREHPEIYAGNIRVRATVERFGAESAERIRPVLFTLAGAVAFVLLTACSNLANLLLARGATREREMAVRNALGASAGRLVRQLLTESLLLTCLGGGLGFLLAQVMIGLSAKLGPGQTPGLRSIQTNTTVLAYTLGLSLLTGILCGLAPALWGARREAGETLKRAGRSGVLGGGRQRVRAALVVVEAGSAVVLLVGAGLLIRSFIEVLRVPPGFSPQGVVAARTTFNRERYPNGDRRRRTERTIVQRLAALPGVTEVAVATHLPLADSRHIGFVLEEADPNDTHWAANALVTGEYFGAMRIPLLRGRTFTDEDTPESPPVAIVNESMALSFWPGADPIGKRILWGGRRLTIVGVAGDVRIKAIEASVEPTVYTSVYQVESGATTSAVFVLRTATANPARLASAVRDALWSVDRALPVFDIRTMEQIVAGSLATRRFAMALLVSFAGLALGLAVIGLYAVLSYVVAQRMPELGLRLALGAAPTSLVSLVVGQGLKLAAAGVVLGMLTGCAAATAMSKLLFGVRPLDPVTFGAAGTLLLCVALAASYIPARRASRVDPLVALRYE